MQRKTVSGWDLSWGEVSNLDKNLSDGHKLGPQIHFKEIEVNPKTEG